MKSPRSTLLLALLMFIGISWISHHLRAEDELAARSPAEIRAAVDALHVEETPWREVAWRTCLIDGLNESRESNKPLILWIFIDRPINDERC